jgi:hypothetical protein
MIVNIHATDDITVAGNTTALHVGDVVKITFSLGLCNAPGHTVKDEHGAVKLFEIIEQDGKMGILYPGRDEAGEWHEQQFTALDKFAWTIDFETL